MSIVCTKGCAHSFIDSAAQSQRLDENPDVADWSPIDTAHSTESAELWAVHSCTAVLIDRRVASTTTSLVQSRSIHSAINDVDDESTASLEISARSSKYCKCYSMYSPLGVAGYSVPTDARDATYRRVHRRLMGPYRDKSLSRLALIHTRYTHSPRPQPVLVLYCAFSLPVASLHVPTRRLIAVTPP